MTTNTLEPLKTLFDLGAHFGYSRSRRHPSADPYVFGFKNRVAIVDLEKSLIQFTKAKEFLAQLGSRGEMVLWVGSKSESRAAVMALATRLNHPYVAARWIGGTLTNFGEIRRRVERLTELEGKSARGELDVYTKKERLGFEKEVRDLRRHFETIRTLEKLPAALVVVDSGEEATAVREARRLSLPVLSLSNTDCDLSLIDYPIVVNDTNRQVIAFFLDGLAKAYEAGKVATSESTPAVTPKL